MSAPRFQVGDKVVLTHADHANMATVPRLVLGRVYCVGKVTLSTPSALFPHAHQRLHLCGVRLRKTMRKPDYGLPFAAFRLVGGHAKEAA